MSSIRFLWFSNFIPTRFLYFTKLCGLLMVWWLKPFYEILFKHCFEHITPCKPDDLMVKPLCEIPFQNCFGHITPSKTGETVEENSHWIYFILNDRNLRCLDIGKADKGKLSIAEVRSMLLNCSSLSWRNSSLITTLPYPFYLINHIEKLFYSKQP